MQALVTSSMQLIGLYAALLCHPQKHGKARGTHTTLLRSDELLGHAAKQRKLQEARQLEASTMLLLRGTCRSSKHTAVRHARYRLTHTLALLLPITQTTTQSCSTYCALAIANLSVCSSRLRAMAHRRE